MDKVVSLYHWRTKDENTTTNLHARFSHWLSNVNPGTLPTDWDMYSFDGTAVNADFIGRYESLAADYSQLCQMLEIPCRNLPVEKKSSRKPYKAYYSKANMNYIRGVFWREIRHFGYTF